jgi:hypothetical protein
LAAARNLSFEDLVDVCDRAASYARSASEAAYRGDSHTVEVHLRQLRLCTIAAIQTFRSLGPETDGEAT